VFFEKNMVPSNQPQAMHPPAVEMATEAAGEYTQIYYTGFQ
jgi:hypothetical protein